MTYYNTPYLYVKAPLRGESQKSFRVISKISIIEKNREKECIRDEIMIELLLV
ncbi:MAG: hypothetical protein KAT34_08795 [Candidatus Aminicenantes bacterium]|nr:hypothetical protein [Candidatus Aminicenantes bacterium]